MGRYEPYHEPYGPPPAYTNVPALQMPSRYGYPGQTPSVGQLQQSVQYNRAGHSIPQNNQRPYSTGEDLTAALASRESAEDEQAVDELAAHYRQYLPPPVVTGLSTAAPASPAALTRPILLPQAFTVSFRQPPPPFVRAYAPVLAARDINIPPALFLAIIDSLNLCLAPPPPLQALSLVGQAVGFVPSHIAQGVSAGIGIVAGVGVAATRITRQKRFLARVNEDVFAPRGLVLEVVKDEEVLRRIGVSLPAVQVAFGPMESGGAHISEATRTRLAQLAPYSASLSWDVPPPQLPTGLMDRISAKQTASRLAKEEKSALKRERKKEERQRRVAEDGSSSSSSDDDSLSSQSQDETSIHAEADARRRAAEARGRYKDVAKIEKERARQLDRLHKKQRKRLEKVNKAGKKVDKNARKADKQELKQADKDRKAMAKLEWVVVRRA